jgi:hypothetical protein
VSRDSFALIYFENHSMRSRRSFVRRSSSLRIPSAECIHSSLETWWKIRCRLRHSLDHWRMHDGGGGDVAGVGDRDDVHAVVGEECDDFCDCHHCIDLCKQNEDKCYLISEERKKKGEREK